MSKVELHLGDCLEILPSLAAGSVDAVVTDPPYPDYHVDLYGKSDIRWLDKFDCRQFIFWSARAKFPLSFSGKHVWDKVNGTGTQYEFIYERNGSTGYKFFRHLSPSSRVRAQIGRDLYTLHPSQKPIRLMRYLIENFSNPNDTILDPFMGSGTTGVACVQTGRNFIGIEIEPKYYEIAEKRIAEAQMQLRMDF